MPLFVLLLMIFIFIDTRTEKFNDPRSVPVVYQLCLAGIDINAVEKEKGDTALHLAARRGKAWRIIIAKE